ncbi:MAG TPA: ATP-binding protein [Stellaceae bacterium]|nr:ATP-binding protein [Stellaceae bacterium]
MGRNLGRSAGFALALSTPGGIAIAALFAFGVIDGAAAIVGAAAMLALSTLITIALLVSLTRARAAIDRLGPEAPPIEAAAPGDRRQRLSLAARVIWPAVLRLRRSWRERAAQANAQVAAAEAVITAVPDPLIMIDRQRRIVRSNAAAAEFVGPEAQPRDLAAALRNPVLLAAADAVLRGEPIRSVEFALSGPIERVLRANFAWMVEPALDGAAAILTLHDVTALKRSEQMRADFIANAGHELKTPLATLIGFIETLLGPAHEDVAARERFLGIMREQAQRMARLVDDLLSLSRIELNEHVAPTDRVALAPVIDEVARGLELRAAERGIRIVRALPADLPEVQGDRDELAQIFQNLLDNAVKYGRPHSEVRVTGGTGSGAVPELVRVAVADQGDGIPSEQLPRLTERFYRVDTARSRMLGGTGLGLAIVKHILNRHRGRLDIASEIGRGSTFTVWLRAAGAQGAIIEE